MECLHKIFVYSAAYIVQQTPTPAMSRNIISVSFLDNDGFTFIIKSRLFNLYFHTLNMAYKINLTIKTTNLGSDTTVGVCCSMYAAE